MVGNDMWSSNEVMAYLTGALAETYLNSARYVVEKIDQPRRHNALLIEYFSSQHIPLASLDPIHSL
jgi:hypothetical protein